VSGLNTTWDMGDRIVTLADVTAFLDSRSRPVATMSARKLKESLTREITGIEPHRVHKADISVPIIVSIDRATGQPTVVLDGNHRLAQAVAMRRDIPFRVMYSDEYDKLFGT